MTKDTPGEGLKPCPFCGSTVKLEKTIYGREWWGVVCRGTENLGGTCAIQQRPSASPEAAIERWNRRSPSVASDTALPSDPAGLVERLRHEARVFDSEYHGTALLMEEAAEAIAALGRVQPVAFDAVANARKQAEASLGTLDRALQQRVERKMAEATPPAPQPALTLIEELERALELADGRLALLLSEFPGESEVSDHPVATRYVHTKVMTALANAKRFKTGE